MTGKMNPEVKKLWLEALRSGEYKQGGGWLHNTVGGDRYCCLGVLCALAMKHEAPGVTCIADGAQVRYGEKGAKMSAHYPPDVVMLWAGLEHDKTNDPRVCAILPKGSTEIQLSFLNDDYNFTFEQIADLIEAQL